MNNKRIKNINKILIKLENYVVSVLINLTKSKYYSLVNKIFYVRYEIIKNEKVVFYYKQFNYVSLRS